MVKRFGDELTYIRMRGVYRLALLAKKLTKVLESIDLSTFRLVAKYLSLVLKKHFCKTSTKYFELAKLAVMQLIGCSLKVSA